MQPLLLASLNDALNLIGIKIIEVGEQWSVSEGKALTRFSDNVVSLSSLYDGQGQTSHLRLECWRNGFSVVSLLVGASLGMECISNMSAVLV